MIIDTSAIIAILRGEPEADAFVQAIISTPVREMSAANWFEAAIVIDSEKDPLVSLALDELCQRMRLVMIPVDELQVRIAREAYRDFGKGSGHPAKLNMGDCFAYALAKDRKKPLLFKGADFVHTDIEPALKPR